MVAASALHPGLSRADLEDLVVARRRLDAWLAGLPDVDLAAATDEDVAGLRFLPSLTGGLVSLLLLTKSCTASALG